MTDFKIIDTPPSSWKQLQEFACRILTECGYTTEIEKTITTVRGEVEVDVYGERNEPFSPKVICECKYWETRVPKNVIHSFRTVIADSGASQGFIISKNGFQNGAYAAVENSNICNLTWDEFQEKFKLEWLKQVIERNYKIGRKLMNSGLKLLTEIHKGNLKIREVELNELYEKRESDFMFFTFKEHYLELDNYELSCDQIDSCISSKANRLDSDVNSYSKYFDYIYQGCNSILEEWQNKYGANLKE